MLELDEFDDDDANVTELIQMFFKAVGMIFNVQQLVREVFNEIVLEVKQSIPSTKDIEVQIYNKLMEGFQPKS